MSRKKNKTNWKKLFLELLVVFFGVTGGFLLNNWQISNQEAKLEQTYLIGFKEDAEKNRIELETSLKKDSLWIAKAKPLLKSCQEKNISIDSAKSIIKLIINISKVQANKGTYIDITNSGNLNIIQDFELRSYIIDYHNVIEGVEFVDAYFYQFFNNTVMPFFLKECSIIHLKFRDPKIISTIEFENVFASYYSLVQQRIESYSNLLEKSKFIKEKLEKKTS